jgi:hypothetical protein
VAPRKAAEPEFDWCAFVPHVIHPAKVAIIEAIQHVGQPLSAKDLEHLLGVPNWDVTRITHYVKGLAEMEALVVSRRRRRGRGPPEQDIYFISDKFRSNA